jgi:peptidyl-prolyl cis-trans isomerase C
MRIRKVFDGQYLAGFPHIRNELNPQPARADVYILWSPECPPPVTLLVTASSNVQEDFDLIKRILIPMLALAFPVFAQQSTPAQPAPSSQTGPADAPATSTDMQKAVAVINGETITVEKLDRLYNNLNAQMRKQYDDNGGKGAFLENYIRKRLMIQEAIKSGFDRRPEVVAAVDAARESALFDRYVRDVVALPIVTESETRKYYDEHPEDFATPEKVHVRHIVISEVQSGPAKKTQGEALERIEKVAGEIRASDTASAKGTTDEKVLAHLRVAHFSEEAKKYSEDGSAESGGDLGWIVKGQTDPDFEKAAWGMKAGTISGIVQTKFGYHLIFVEAREPVGTEPYENVKSTIREFLLTQKAPDVMASVTRLTNELRANSRISAFPENIK